MAQNCLPPESETKVQNIEYDLKHLRETGNTQHAYRAIQQLFRIIEQGSDNWIPDIDTNFLPWPSD